MLQCVDFMLARISRAHAQTLGKAYKMVNLMGQGMTSMKLSSKEDTEGMVTTLVGAEGAAEPAIIDDYSFSVPSEQSGEIITIEELACALKLKMGKKGEAREDSVRKLAEYILNFFGYSDMIIDNVLNPDDRDVFYTLEEEGILGTEREEMYILKGKVWRIHYWMLKKKEIKRLCQKETLAKECHEDAYANVYESLDEEMWKHN